MPNEDDGLAEPMSISVSNANPSSTNLIGQQLRTPDGIKLQLREVLGHGAYGTVYLARMRRLRNSTAADCLYQSDTPHVPDSRNYDIYNYFAVKHLDDQSSHAAPGGMKVPSPSRETIRRRRRRQRREATLHKFITTRIYQDGECHPGITKMLDAVESTDRIHRFLILEYCSDGDLFSYVTSVIPRLPPDIREKVVKDGFTQIADAVSWCHAQLIYHRYDVSNFINHNTPLRDLKCENILVIRDSRWSADASGSTEIVRFKLADFGFAINEMELKQRRLAQNWCRGYGSKFYMSPEALPNYVSRRRSARSDTASPTTFYTGSLSPVDEQYEHDDDYIPEKHDVWALGVILCNMCTQRHPWRVADDYVDGNYAFYVSNAIKQNSVAAIKELVGVEQNVAFVLAGAWIIDPQSRWTAGYLCSQWLAVHGNVYYGKDKYVPKPASDQCTEQQIRNFANPCLPNSANSSQLETAVTRGRVNFELTQQGSHVLNDENTPPSQTASPGVHSTHAVGLEQIATAVVSPVISLESRWKSRVKRLSISRLQSKKDSISDANRVDISVDSGSTSHQVISDTSGSWGIKDVLNNRLRGWFNRWLGPSIAATFQPPLEECPNEDITDDVQQNLG